MASQAKESIDRAVNRKKPLRLPRRFAPAHLVCSLARRLMRDFRSIVAATNLAVAHAEQELAAGRTITPQMIAHKPTGSVVQTC